MKLGAEGYRAQIVAILASFAVVCFYFGSAPLAQPRAGVGTAYNRCIAVTPSDTVDLAPYTQNQMLPGTIYVGGAGNVTAVNPDGSTYLLTAPPVGSLLPIAVRRINATGTTATVMVACYAQ